MHKENSSFLKKDVSNEGKIKRVCFSPNRCVLNWAPYHLAGENEETQQKHKDILKAEFQKSPKNRDVIKISNSMALTFSLRRQSINVKVPIIQLVGDYPFIFGLEHQIKEFNRVTSIEVKEVKQLFVEEISPKIV